VSLYGENLEKEIVLEAKKVEVHPGQSVQAGNRLNKACVVTLKNVFD
jgi:hypothetical protein